MGNLTFSLRTTLLRDHSKAVPINAAKATATAPRPLPQSTLLEEGPVQWTYIADMERRRMADREAVPYDCGCPESRQHNTYNRI